MKINIFWFRRDLRLDDNTALDYALGAGLPVLPVFIFDTNITDDLPADDSRISFIYQTLASLSKKINTSGNPIFVLKGDPVKIFTGLIISNNINAVYANKDYEPYSIGRDSKVEALLEKNSIRFYRFRDQVIFEEKEIVRPDGNPYLKFTPYKKQWLKEYEARKSMNSGSGMKNNGRYFDAGKPFPELRELGFRNGSFNVRPFDLSAVKEYDRFRDYPWPDRTTHLSPHLRFGTVSIRTIADIAASRNHVFLGELIWREFFMQILFNFPDVLTENFRPVYNNITWRNNESEFTRWCNGETGYPIVDAGMHQLNETGYMHNRIRMIAASFLCKHLLCDWRLGEAYFAQKLLDYELSSNNGNWQWAAGTGSDAVPYFRIFNPDIQSVKYDRDRQYIKKWNGETGKPENSKRVVEHIFARRRALETYRAAAGLFVK